MEVTPAPQLLRPSEVADRLGIALSRVYAMCSSGELPVVKLGKSIRVSTEALRSWIDDRTTVPGDL